MTTRATALRRGLVRDLETHGVIRTPAVRDAFLSVPRELFLPGHELEAVYRDDAIPTKFAPSGVPVSSSSQPAIMAEMLERLALEPGLRILEIGAGTGYNAALLAETVGPRGRVTSIDVDADTARRARKALRDGGYRVRILHGDGRTTVAGPASFDRIVVTASADTVPLAWFEQLVEGGILVVPLRLREAAGAHVVAALRRGATGFSSVSLVPGGFMPLRSEDEDGMPRGLGSVQATAVSGGAPDMFCQIGGAGLERMTRAARRRLLATALATPRTEPLDRRSDARALVLYLSTTLPAAQLVTVLPDFGVGVAERDGSGLAYVTARGKPAIRAHGAPAAYERLRRAIDKWSKLGRPGFDAFSVDVSYDGGKPLLGSRWAGVVR